MQNQEQLFPTGGLRTPGRPHYIMEWAADTVVCINIKLINRMLPDDLWSFSEFPKPAT